MGKGQRHTKHLKSEKAKVKLKAKKVKNLPKGLNITDTSFKVKKVVVREQLKQHDKDEILSKRKLNVKDLLTRLQHNNSTARQEALKQLKEILIEHSLESVSSQFSGLLHSIVALILDKEKEVRRDTLKVLSLILNSLTVEQLLPFCDLLNSYLICTMTHIDPRIKEDSLLFMDILIEHCKMILQKSSYRILPSFLDLISKLHTETKPGRQLITIINSKHTSLRWRTKVLQRLCIVLNSIIQDEVYDLKKNFNNERYITDAQSFTNGINLLKTISTEICAIDFPKNKLDDPAKITSDPEKFTKYVNMLMQLMFDIWIEVCPDDNMMYYKDFIIPNEASVLLKHIVDIIQFILILTDKLRETDSNIGIWMKNNFFAVYKKKLFSRFPYSTKKATDTMKKKECPLLTADNENCLQQNLALCQIYIWFTVADHNEENINVEEKAQCNRILKYLNGSIEQWRTSDNTAIPYLTTILRTLFFRASETWCKNKIDISGILNVIMHACNRQPWKDLQSALFVIISDVILNLSLHSLHREVAFKEFISMLPNLLLKRSIHANTIELIKKVVLRYKDWVSEKLALQQDAILSNAKTIEIIGSKDDKYSRLAICNMFYCIDGQIYY